MENVLKTVGKVINISLEFDVQNMVAIPVAPITDAVEKLSQQLNYFVC